MEILHETGAVVPSQLPPPVTLPGEAAVTPDTSMISAWIPMVYVTLMVTSSVPLDPKGATHADVKANDDMLPTSEYVERKVSEIVVTIVMLANLGLRVLKTSTTTTSPEVTPEENGMVSVQDVSPGLHVVGVVSPTLYWILVAAATA